ncbi:hypothetical protein R3P38DRAFT_2832784 [Favolaschia claudopus]|uniref:Uncharacterized protein n=1 Tax=Favolaschia claudopus TaxID=2862362 RepID=A0AAW0EE92_9AGAR
MAVTATSAAFFEIIIGSFIYGLFLSLSIFSNMLYIQRIGRSQGMRSRRMLMGTILRKPMIIGGLLMTLLISARWILDVIDTAHGFLVSRDPELYFAAPLRPRAVVEVGFVPVSVLICDIMIIYRLWIVWNKSSVVVLFPMLALLGQLANGIGGTYQLAVTRPGESMYTGKLEQWLVQESVFNLGTNLYATGFIAYRICATSFGLSDPTITRVNTGNNLSKSMAIVVESCVLLSVWIIIGIISYSIKSPFHWFVLGNIGTISGIAFMLINVRVALGWSQSDEPIVSASKIVFNADGTLSVPAGVTTDIEVDNRTDPEAGKIAPTDV